MEEYVVLSKNEIADLYEDKPMQIQVSENPNILYGKKIEVTLCSEEYFEEHIKE
jgi:hypothetical protein